jgi:hypothetical protein
VDWLYEQVLYIYRPLAELYCESEAKEDVRAE